MYLQWREDSAPGLPKTLSVTNVNLTAHSPIADREALGSSLRRELPLLM